MTVLPPSLIDAAVRAVADELGMAWTTVMGITIERGTAAVGTASLDPFRGLRHRAGRAAARRGRGDRVLDPFHVVKLGLTCVEDVRRRVQQDTLGHRSRAGNPLFGFRRVLRRCADRLTTKARGRLEAGLVASDPDGETILTSDRGPGPDGPLPAHRPRHRPHPRHRADRRPAELHDPRDRPPGPDPCTPGAASSAPTSSTPKSAMGPPRTST